ncbi:sulfotransferase family 2 domain-containing protein [Neptunicoccus sediminis]|uniref:sulfotransferase family 2 domain-containing protein n=1 Tax=Neptunicoccus sediminis TaxID=1892596 RepID=UPI000845C363|nr:sulfotransferase family 2 domain-containing protein [Neptunicoccus sediminis]
MMIDYDRKLVFLSNRKVASTSMERALGQVKGMARLNGNPVLKHIDYTRYKRMEQPLRTKGFTTITVVREPFDKAVSWYKFRARPELQGDPRYVGDLDFKTFLNNFITGKSGWAMEFLDNLFCVDSRSNETVDIIHKYENLGAFETLLQSIYGADFSLPHLNVSAPVADTDFSVHRPRYEAAFPEAFEWYRALPNPETALTGR